jgi:amino-acid N-acetyltransferase
MTIQKANRKDLPGILKLLNLFKLPVQDVVDNLGNFYVLKENDRMVACVGLEKFETTCLLRSLAIVEDKQGLGLGKFLVEEILKEIKKGGIKTVYLMTTDAADYFEKFNFRVVCRKHVHEDIRNTLEFTTLCPESVLCMCKTLK